IAFDHKDPTRRLRALWALHVSGGLGFEEVEKALKDSDPHVRGWTIQLAMERPSANLVMMDKLVDLAANDPSPVVRRYLASALQRSTYDVREAVLEQLLGWDKDATDPNLPLLC